MIDMGTDIVTVEWDEENINKRGNKVQISGGAVLTLKFFKATHAKDTIFAKDISNLFVILTLNQPQDVATGLYFCLRTIG